MRSKKTELALKFGTAAVALNLYTGSAVADDADLLERDISIEEADQPYFSPVNPFFDMSKREIEPITVGYATGMRLAAQPIGRFTPLDPSEVTMTVLDNVSEVTEFYFENAQDVPKNEVSVPVVDKSEKKEAGSIVKKEPLSNKFNGCHNGYSYNDFFADIVNGDEGVQTTVTAMIDGAAREFFPFAFGGKEIVSGGGHVKSLQLLLMRMGGYKTFNRHDDGDLGGGTRTAIKRCQQQLKDTYANIQVDGRATATFLEALAYEGAKTLIYTAHFIRQEADHLDLDQKDSLLFLNHESRGPGDYGLNPFITSGSGPIGVGQVAPSTYGGQIRGGKFHQGEAQKMGIHKTIIPRSQAKRELTDIETNVKVSLFYIKGMMKQFRLKSVLKGWASGYNLGPGAASCLFKLVAGKSKCHRKPKVDKNLKAAVKRAKSLNGLAKKPNSSVIPANVKKLKNKYNVNQVNRLLHYTTGLYIATNTHTKLLGGGLHGYNTKKALKRAP